MAPMPGRVLLQDGLAVAAPCRHSKDNPAPGSRGRDQLRQAAFSPKANTRVAKRLGFHEVKANLEGDSGPPRDGREPSWARPCEASGALLLSNGGSGGGHETCTLWPPPAPFGYFPVMESTSSARRRTKPPTRNRFPVGGRKRAFLTFPVSQRVSPLRRRPKGFPIALWKPSAPMQRTGFSTENGFFVEGEGKAFLAFSCFTEGFGSSEATRGLSHRPLDSFGGEPLFASEGSYFASCAQNNFSISPKE